MGAERTIDKKKADKLAAKIKSGKGFDLEDFLDQIHQMKKMGGLTSMLDKLPGMGNMRQMAKQTEAAEGQFKQMEAIIYSMTRDERHFPDKINGSRKKRIAAGSGTKTKQGHKKGKDKMVKALDK